MKNTNSIDDELSEADRLSIIGAFEKDMEAAIKLCVDFEFAPLNYSDEHIITSLGNRWSNTFFSIRKKLASRYGECFDDLILLSNRYFVYACYYGVANISLLVKCGYVDDDKGAKLTTPDSYADFEGWANTLYTQVPVTDKPVDLLSGTRFSSYPRDHEILEAKALVWMVEASFLINESKDQALNLLCEASEAIAFANGAHMWEESAEDSASEIPRQLASRGGKGRANKYEEICAEAQRLAREMKPLSGKWQSRRDAVKKIKPAVFAFAKEKDVTLSEDQAPVTIDNWLAAMPEGDTLFAGKRTTPASTDATPTS